ncbi:MAG: hypothetical protein ACOYKZ_01075 [Chlamydiia bacterium]
MSTSSAPIGRHAAAHIAITQVQDAIEQACRGRIRDFFIRCTNVLMSQGLDQLGFRAIPDPARAVPRSFHLHVASSGHSCRERILTILLRLKKDTLHKGERRNYSVLPGRDSVDLVWMSRTRQRQPAHLDGSVSQVTSSNNTTEPRYPTSSSRSGPHRQRLEEGLLAHTRWSFPAPEGLYLARGLVSMRTRSAPQASLTELPRPLCEVLGDLMNATQRPPAMKFHSNPHAGGNIQGRLEIIPTLQEEEDYTRLIAHLPRVRFRLQRLGLSILTEQVPNDGSPLNFTITTRTSVGPKCRARMQHLRLDVQAIQSCERARQLAHAAIQPYREHILRASQRTASLTHTNAERLTHVLFELLVALKLSHAGIFFVSHVPGGIPWDPPGWMPIGALMVHPEDHQCKDPTCAHRLRQLEQLWDTLTPVIQASEQKLKNLHCYPLLRATNYWIELLIMPNLQRLLNAAPTGTEAQK